MITVAIIGILAAVALPSYRDYIVRGHLVDGTNLLATSRANMERFFQDNRTYAVVGTIYPPCDVNITVAARTQGNFVLTCSAVNANGYTLVATGNGPVTGFVYTVTQTDARATIAAQTGWTTSTTCWAIRRGQTC